MTDERLRISGSVVDRRTRRGVERLRVEAWDKDLLCDDLVGSDVTNAQGDFHIEFNASYFKELFADRHPDLFFKVFRAGSLIQSTESSVLWNMRAAETRVRIEVDSPPQAEPPADGDSPAWLTIDSFDELRRHEEAILERIRATPNGGNLFITHPFMLLAELGVRLSERARDEIMRHEPHLSALSPLPYRALKASTAAQPVRFQLHGLFQRRPV